MLATAAHRQRSRRLTEKLVEKFENKVKKFEEFSDHSLGIKSYKPMEILEDAQGDIDPWTKTRVAILMENFMRETMANRELLETSRASLPAWVKNGLALIAAANAEDILDRVISVQPMSNRLGRIHYLFGHGTRHRHRSAPGRPLGRRPNDCGPGLRPRDHLSAGERKALRAYRRIRRMHQRAATKV